MFNHIDDLQVVRDEKVEKAYRTCLILVSSALYAKQGAWKNNKEDLSRNDN